MKKEVIIGNQVWMTENLNVDKFRNGDPIPQAKTYEEWETAGENGQPAWCYYDNAPKNGEKYGKLYNWYAVNAPRGLAPVGFHVPSDAEWEKLVVYLGSDAGEKMKSKRGWDNYQIGAEIWSGNGSNDSRFYGLPGGSRYYVGDYYGIGYLGYWWSSTEFNTVSAWGRGLGSDDGVAYRSNYSKTFGFSVRCLRD